MSSSTEPLCEHQLAPWNPERDDPYFTLDAQVAAIDMALTEEAAGRSLSRAIVDHADELVGRST
ncbi:hypothetical protein [Cryptosporangium aurantiacum]|uniref:Uncharacterized protein n=1 Tax=Cryptosporangium aurantiacum TaxID=134849 RepID=A0A1M7RP22_9ACTN|nr:hypothetical protein [Cryptosporangium aurantiacum]SHN47900.1 hypothetical protein SAMN05443668_1303 [Cryptosporangium aurantiacum]